MSAHSQISAPVAEYTLGSKAVSVERISSIIGIVGLFGCVVGFFTSPYQFFQSYLFAFMYFAGFAIGGLGLLLLNNVVGGKWGVTIRRFNEAAARTMPLIALFFVVIMFGIKYIYGWATPEFVKANEFLTHKMMYLNPLWFYIRGFAFLAFWIILARRLNKWTDEQDQTGDPAIREKMRKFSAPFLLLFVLTVTFAVFDWVLSADQQFYSTIFGALLLIAAVQATLALSILSMIRTSADDRFDSRVNSKILHDLGKLLFAFTIFWTYLSASQLIIVWPADLPQEIQWYLDRTQGFWKVFATFVGLTMFAIPFLALLSQDRKKDPRRLQRVTIWVLVVQAVYQFWLIEPAFRSAANSPSVPQALKMANHFTIYWTDFAAFAGIGGIWVWYYLKQLRARPLLPLKDPRVMESLPEEVVA